PRPAGHDHGGQALRAGPADRAAGRLRHLALPVGHPDPGGHALLRAEGDRGRHRAAGQRQLDAARADHLHHRPVQPDPATARPRVAVTWEFSSASLLALLLATVRASAWLVVCPPFNNRLMPGPVKALLALALAL